MDYDLSHVPQPMAWAAACSMHGLLLVAWPAADGMAYGQWHDPTADVTGCGLWHDLKTEGSLGGGILPSLPYYFRMAR